MSDRPSFKSYIMARLVSMASAIFVLFSSLFYLLFEDKNLALMGIALLALAFGLFIFLLYKGALGIEVELQRINHYLQNVETVEASSLKTDFFSHEFDQINQNLTKVLKKVKKREEKKQRDSAKIKLKNRQRADMISAIAHEFRNPIASIMGYAQTLKEDKEIPAPLQEKFLGKIYNNGAKIDALLGRLVLWNKFESGEAKLEAGYFDSLSLTQEVLAWLEEKYPQRTITVQGAGSKLHADRTLIEIVLNNLIENALKYSDDAVTIVLEKEKISVIDKGAGIPQKELSKITKKFYRSDTHAWDNSMGLGLSIVKKILTLHKTELVIQSQQDKGSTFSFVLKVD